jgi:hypothetical protein
MPRELNLDSGRGKASGPATGSTQHRSRQVSGTLFWMVKRPERGADQSSIHSTKVKNAWRCALMPPYGHAVVLNEVQRKFVPLRDINLLKPSGNFTYDQVSH